MYVSRGLLDGKQKNCHHTDDQKPETFFGLMFHVKIHHVYRYCFDSLLAFFIVFINLFLSCRGTGLLNATQSAGYPQWPTIVKPETWPKAPLHRANTIAGVLPPARTKSSSDKVQLGQSPARTKSSTPDVFIGNKHT